MAAIPPEHIPKILSLSGQGKTTREIAAILLAEFGVKVSYSTVAALLKEHREERAVASQGILRERLGKELPADLDALQGIFDDLGERAKECLDSKGKLSQERFYSYLKVKELQVKILDRKLHYAGGDEPDDKAKPVYIVSGEAQPLEEIE